jgi:ribose transport system ATP-binding protein
VSLVGVTKLFPGVKALDDVSISIGRGEIMGLVGANGAGKSTMVRVLAGAYPDYSGDVQIGGRCVRLKSPQASRRCGIAVASQDPMPMSSLRLWQALFIGNEITTRPFGLLSAAAMRQKCREALSELGCDADPDVLVGTLPRPALQLAEIAKVFLTSASFVVLDEPTAVLSPTESSSVFAAVRRRVNEGSSALIISHRLAEILDVCNRVGVLRDGKLVYLGPAETTDFNVLQRHMFGEVNEYPPNIQETSSEQILLEVEAISTPHYSGISFSVTAGEIVGLVAPSYENPAELLRALFGLVPIRSGEVALSGRRLAKLSPQACVECGIGYLSDNRASDGLFPDLSVAVNMAFPVLDRLSHWGLLRPSSVLEAARAKKDELAIRAPSLEEPIRHLSGGNQQKSLLARCLLTDVRLLLLEEPFAGIDIKAKREIAGILRSIRRSGRSSLITSTEPDELLAVCDTLLFLRGGRVTAVEPAASVHRANIAERLTGVG